MTKRFGFHSNSQGADEIQDLPISIDFQVQKHGVVTPVQYYNSMVGYFQNVVFSFGKVFKIFSCEIPMPNKKNPNSKTFSPHPTA